jgi:putative membrane protein
MHHSSWATFEMALAFFSVLALLAYWTAAFVQRSSPKGWHYWRTLSFSSGIFLLLIALLPSVVALAHHDMRGHMAQHLLLGMFAPLGLVLGAPVTLALRSASPQIARGLVTVLRSRWIRFVSHPVTAMILNIGGMYLLYFTPIYAAMHESVALHALVHWHFLAAGCLFTWAIAGPDPAPHRPGKGFRLFVMFVSIAAHGFLSKAMYAYGGSVSSHHSMEEIRAGAKIMYYGGDFAELLLVIALFAGGTTHCVSQRRKNPAGAGFFLLR